DHPIEQYCRDAKIFSIYEGTNHIQALDLVARKLGRGGGATFQAFAKDVNAFVRDNQEHPELGAAIKELSSAINALGGTAMRFLGWFRAREVEKVPLAANRFLEMMAETVVAWLLLDGAVIADKALADVAEGHPDRAFYEGRKYSALFFARNVLPGVRHKADLVGVEDISAMEIPEAAFSTL
ncbi:MAG: acyl-CoA dehydrogenase, partial [Myxococcota bacterium]